MELAIQDLRAIAKACDVHIVTVRRKLRDLSLTSLLVFADVTDSDGPIIKEPPRKLHLWAVSRDWWAASTSATGTCCGEASSGSFLNQSALKLCRAARHDILDFLRENSPLGVCDDGIGGVLMIRSRVSVDVAGLFQEFGRDSNVAVSMFSVI